MLQIDGVYFCCKFDDILLVLCCVVCLLHNTYKRYEKTYTRHRKDIVIMWKCTQHYVEIHRKMTGNVTSQAHKQETLGISSLLYFNLQFFLLSVNISKKLFKLTS